MTVLTSLLAAIDANYFKAVGEGIGAIVLYAIVGVVLVLLGFYARAGAALIAVNMLFAVALAHRPDLFSFKASGAWALELQAFFLFSALALMFMGPGRLGINRR